MFLAAQREITKIASTSSAAISAAKTEGTEGEKEHTKNELRGAGKFVLNGSDLSVNLYSNKCHINEDLVGSEQNSE